MRGITGEARGRRLKELSGMDTRPTPDKVKESMFNIVQFDIEGRKVLDLFAGTGQLGIEALSRGAESAVFVDVRKDAAALIGRTCPLRLCRPARWSRGLSGLLTGCREKFDLVFLDPPYASGFLEKALETIAAIDIVSENGIIVCESAQETVLRSCRPLCGGAEYRYGKIKLTTCRARV
jgi:16S rRNA (guanine(966)-N(2))-methyltransferase RsmD